MQYTAVLAEDEPLLLTELVSQLNLVWSELQIVGQAKNGVAALEQIRALRPSIAFLDIRMPGATGLEVAQALAEDAAADEPVPLIVFVTAYGEFAVEAFEASAIDYLLKPVTTERLSVTSERLRKRLAVVSAASSAQALADQLMPLIQMPRPQPSQPLKYLRVGRGTSVHLVPLDQIRYFQAADKYVLVFGNEADGEGLIRESLRDLQMQLDSQQFVQIHRSTLVNLDYVERADRDELGRTQLRLRGVANPLIVSRLYNHLFKPM